MKWIECICENMYADVLVNEIPRDILVALYRENAIIDGVEYELYELKSDFGLNSRYMLVETETGKVRFEKDRFELTVEFVGEVDLSKFDEDEFEAEMGAEEVGNEETPDVGVKLDLKPNGGSITLFINEKDITIEEFVGILRYWRDVLEYIGVKLVRR